MCLCADRCAYKNVREQISNLESQYVGVHCVISSTSVYENFPKNWRGKTRLGGKEMETINTDNFSEGLAAKEAKKWGIGGKCESLLSF